MRIVLSLCFALMLGLIGTAELRAQSGTGIPLPDGLRGTLPDVASPTPLPMVFRLGRFAGSPGCGLQCAEFIYAYGEIRPDSVEALMILQSRVGKPLPVIINSPGGNLDGGLSLGRAFRKARSETRVAALAQVECRRPTSGKANACTDADQRGGVAVFLREEQQGLCNSSCVYAFAGGVKRELSNGSALGVHRFFLTRADDPYRRPLLRYGKAEAARLDKTHDIITAYLNDMGVSPETLRLAANVEPQDIRHLTSAEAARLQLTTPQPFAALGSPPLSSDPTPTGALRAMIAPPAEAPWPMVRRAGQPYIVLSRQADSRRFGRITAEVAITCKSDGGRYMLAFRELVVSRPDKMQDAMVRVEPDHFGELARQTAPTLLRDVALRADERGVLVLEVTSSATAGYPTRLEFPGRGLRDGIERLDRACNR